MVYGVQFRAVVGGDAVGMQIPLGLSWVFGEVGMGEGVFIFPIR